MKKLLIAALFLCATSAQPADTEGKTMHILIGGQRFAAELADTAAARELQTLLPLTLEMEAHLRNEKFAGLPRSLPTADQRAGRIEAGDIMLWQGNTVVIFYESFDSSYRYTRLGKIRDTQGLAQALGAGDVQVRIE